MSVHDIEQISTVCFEKHKYRENNNGCANVCQCKAENVEMMGKEHPEHAENNCNEVKRHVKITQNSYCNNIKTFNNQLDGLGKR